MKNLSFFTRGLILVCIAFIFSCESKIETENPDDFLVMAYYAGNETAIDEYDIGELTRWIEENNLYEYWDETASAPYACSPEGGLFVTYDNQRSVTLKTNYAMDEGLGGIMFWQLTGDKERGGLLDAIYQAIESR